MAYKEGNQLWKQRAKHGKSKKFETPEILEALIYDYFQWAEDNPFKEVKLFQSEGAIIEGSINKPRALTLAGLCAFLGLALKNIYEYEKVDGYREVIARARAVMFSQKFEGAAAGFFQQNIIARELGLVEKTANEVKIVEQPLFPEDEKSDE